MWRKRLRAQEAATMPYMANALSVIKEKGRKGYLSGVLLFGF
jgi:hypothetical protein